MTEWDTCIMQEIRMYPPTQSTIDNARGNVAMYVGWVDQDPVSLCRGIVME